MRMASLYSDGKYKLLPGYGPVSEPYGRSFMSRVHIGQDVLDGGRKNV